MTYYDSTKSYTIQELHQIVMSKCIEISNLKDIIVMQEHELVHLREAIAKIKDVIHNDH